MEKYNFVITENEEKRLDIFLQEKFSDFSRSFFKNLIDNG